MKSITLFLENLDTGIVGSHYRHVGNKKVNQPDNDIRSVNTRQTSSAKHMAKADPKTLGGAKVFTTP